MNKQTEALKMAYDWVNEYAPSEVVQAVKEALEQPAQDSEVQEPVAWECFSDPAYYDMWAIRQIGNRNFDETIHVVNGKEAKQLCTWLNSLNTHPAPSWQGLSGDELDEIVDRLDVELILNCSIADFVGAIEQALKEKNYG